MPWMKKPGSPVCGVATQSYMALCEKEIIFLLLNLLLLLFPWDTPILCPHQGFSLAF